MAVALLDSSALIGYLDADDALHASAVRVIERLLRDCSALAISAVSGAEGTPDALILATASATGPIDTLVCGDRRWLDVPGVDAEIALLLGA